MRDAFNHAAGLRQVIALDGPKRYVAVGYRFDREDALRDSGRQFAYDGHEMSLGVGWRLPADLTTEVGYAYRREVYDVPSGGRRDNEHQFTAVLQRALGKGITLTAAYLGTLNDSNQGVFMFDRHIGSLTLEVRY